MNEWVSVKDRLPTQREWEGKRIAVLVNGISFVASVMQRGCLYASKDEFLFCSDRGWISDPRFAIPTHWMPLPEKPEISS